MDLSSNKGSKDEPHQTKVKGDVRAKEQHKEIEKNRRHKICSFVDELASLLPNHNSRRRKPDKLTILQEAVAHLKNVRRFSSQLGTDHFAYLTITELKKFIQEAADGFLFVVNIQTGKIIYVADQVKPILNVLPEYWAASTIYEQVHPGDVKKIREQISLEGPQYDGTVYLKKGTLKNSSMKNENSYKRNFIARFKVGRLNIGNNISKLQRRIQSIQEFAVLHCSGVVVNKWPFLPSVEDIEDSEKCLVTLGRLEVTSKSKTNEMHDTAEFLTRLNEDGKFIFIDQRVLGLTGYIPIDLLGRSLFEFVHPEENSYVKTSFKHIISLKGQTFSTVLRFFVKNSKYVQFRISSYAFMNPYLTENVEYVVCNFIVTKPYQREIHGKNDLPLKNTELRYSTSSSASPSGGLVSIESSSCLSNEALKPYCKGPYTARGISENILTQDPSLSHRSSMLSPSATQQFDRSLHPPSCQQNESSLAQSLDLSLNWARNSPPTNYFHCLQSKPPTNFLLNTSDLQSTSLNSSPQIQENLTQKYKFAPVNSPSMSQSTFNSNPGNHFSNPVTKQDTNQFKRLKKLEEPYNWSWQNMFPGFYTPTNQTETLHPQPQKSPVYPQMENESTEDETITITQL